MAWSVHDPMKRPGQLSDKERLEHVETLALLARLVVLTPAPYAGRRLFFVLSA